MRHYITPHQYQDGDVLLNDEYGRARILSITSATDLDAAGDPAAHIAWIEPLEGDRRGATRAIWLAPTQLLVVEREDS